MAPAAAPMEARGPLAPTVELPRTPVGQLAQALVDVINSGKISEQREFVRSHFSDRALKETTIDDWVAFLDGTWKASGGIDVVTIPPPRRPNRFPFEVRARRGQHRSIFVIETPKAEEGRIAGIFANPELGLDRLRKGALRPVAMTEADAARAIARRVDQFAIADRFSGVVLVLKGDRVLVSAPAGQADKAAGAPNGIDTKFNLGSMNKMFTAVAIGQLIEKGKLSFGDKLSKVLTDYPNRAFAESVTIHQLLTHTPGIGGNLFAPAVMEQLEYYKRPNDFVQVLAKEPPPGERFGYSNYGFVVLGAVVERLSGEDYFDYVRGHIFEPANMRNTASFEVDEVVQNLAVGYRVDDNDAFGILPRRTNLKALHYKGTPAGGGYSTAPDLSTFAAALRNHKLLSAAATEMLTAPKVDSPGPLPGMRYGYGFQSRTVRGKEVRGHTGGNAGISAALHMFWDGSYTVIALANYDGAEMLIDEIVEFLAVQGEK